MLTPIPQQDAGHLDQPEVVGSLLLVAYQYGPAFRQPAQCTFHHPSPRRIAFHARIIEFLLADLADVRDVDPLFDDLPRWRFVVALVQAQVLITRRLFGGSGPLDHDGIERGLQQLEVGHVRCGYHHRKRTAIGLDQQGAFDPVFGSVGGIGASEIPNARLAHRPIGGLPLEVYSAEFLALLDELLPDEIEYAKLDPPLQSAVHRRVVGELFLGQLVPLAAATHPEDDRIEGLALVYARTTASLWRIVLFEDRFDDDPQLIGYSPYSGKRLLWGRVLGHIGTSSLRE